MNQLQLDADSSGLQKLKTGTAGKYHLAERYRVSYLSCCVGQGPVQV